MVVSVLVGGSHTCILRGLHTYFPPHEPYIVANDCEYYTVPYLCIILCSQRNTRSMYPYVGDNKQEIMMVHTLSLPVY